MTGLVLEGGGMRGLYTAGVLESFSDMNIMFDYVIGVSAGACHGLSFITGQRGRNFRINTEYLNDKRYLSFSNFIKTKSMFGMDFLFGEIPNNLDVFDFEAFMSSPCRHITGVTDAETGKPVYFEKADMDRNYTLLRASTSIPCFSPVVDLKGGKYYDGGTTDPIPYGRALEDGCDKVVVVLTRDRNYIKPPEKFRVIYKRLLKKYPKMIEVLDRRHIVYNESLSELKKLEACGTAFVIAPSAPLSISRFEKNKDNLNKIYQMGMQDTNDLSETLLDYLRR